MRLLHLVKISVEKAFSGSIDVRVRFGSIPSSKPKFVTAFFSNFFRFRKLTTATTVQEN